MFHDHKTSVIAKLVATHAPYPEIRLVPIMLWSNAPEFCLLCSNYVPYVSHAVTPQIHHSFHLSYLNHKIMSISSLYLAIYFPNTVQFHLSS